jgi:predicted DNA-binding protein
MPKPTQLPVQFPPDVLSQLRRQSAESGRSIAALVREAVDRYLNPTEAKISASALWSILRDPAHWLEFKRIAAEMEAATPPELPAAPPAPAEPPAPAYRFKRAEGVAARAVAEEERPPF